MTTQASYGQDFAGYPSPSDPYTSQPLLPRPQYPTAPPWAQPPTAPPSEFDLEAPHLRHGQALVRYPEELELATRPRPPAAWPVAVWTLLFGVFGAIPARRRAATARRIRAGVAPYWIVFGVSLVLGALVTVGVGQALILPGYLELREGAVLKQLQENIVTDGELQKAAKLTATEAKCQALDERGDDGLRGYSCVLTLASGKDKVLRVTADSNGDWTVMKRR
ncbi:hypothetical protein EV385_4602 [Krasilnikovia cinnamomea]|uniref:DUF4333 domain-containing protein n=1 Tax=Krasilnikovia cinnamomea TaxID=349313 RepID=A0A4Q7ZPS5_9ACTN|nr:hypothetical protein [Krasilnikovia cinnamomea]RZU52721.1 hypothetical protein EV385_4602 [Krasilnikovia cinnamomea]